jgi:TPR repeat protein
MSFPVFSFLTGVRGTGGDNHPIKNMAHDVFISHSSKDKPVADAACVWLESRGIRCWVAPRDIRPGANWGSSIVQAIRGARVMILIFSSNANASPQIKREVERAVHFGVTVMPVRIEDVFPADDLEYFLGMPHWLDAFTPPLEQHLDALARAVKEILDIPAPPPIETAAGNPGEPGAEPEHEFATGPIEVPETVPPPAPPPSDPPLSGAPADAPAQPAATPQSSSTRVILYTLLAVFLVLSIGGAVLGGLYKLAAERSAPNAPLNVEAGSKQPPATTAAPPPAVVQTPAAAVTPAPAPSAPSETPVATAAREPASPPQTATPATPAEPAAGSLAWFQKAAAQGNADAQYQLGYMYASGTGVPQDLALALSWYQKSAAQGQVDALTNLGTIYAKGIGVSQDYAAAVGYYLKAANLGGPNAQVNMGLMYANGWGVSKDYTQAFAWFQKGAQQGNADGENNLGYLYQHGLGVKTDLVQARAWFQKSADQGNARAQASLMQLNGR